jgi:TPR repeat protein
VNVEDRDKLWDQGHSVLNSGDEDLAIALFSRLVDTGDWRGAYMLGWIAESKGKRDQKNYVAAAHWYTRALSLEDSSPPHLALARYYYYGLGGYYDYKQAFEHLQKCHPERDPIVQMMMAELLYLGLGVSRDVKTARELFTTSATAGYPAAFLGLMSLAKAKKEYGQVILYFLRALFTAIKLVIKNKNDPLLTGIGGKRGTLRRNWVGETPTDK